MKPLYKFSFSEAKRNGEMEECRESFRENIRCRDFLDNEITERFDGMYLPSECAENTVKEFGYDRTMWVIANTVQERDGDGRFHSKNRDWAKSLHIPKENRNYEFALKSHSCIVDGLAGQVQDMYEKLGLFSGKHIVQSDEPQDYKGKLLIIRAEVLKEECRTPENQLFLASSGFGCSPGSSGRKVFGQFLSDGEKAQFYRSDFVGVVSDEHIPDWAKEKMEQIQAQQEQETAPEQTINLNM
ncbi:MAG: DUF3849 domain-containing protein [Bacteroidales bacterium]|nr:DUF3849 domain-containing protein [Bacteroidales bacterium]